MKQNNKKLLSSFAVSSWITTGLTLIILFIFGIKFDLAPFLGLSIMYQGCIVAMIEQQKSKK